MWWWWALGLLSYYLIVRRILNVILNLYNNWINVVSVLDLDCVYVLVNNICFRMSRSHFKKKAFHGFLPDRKWYNFVMTKISYFLVYIDLELTFNREVFFSYVTVPSGIDLIRCKKRNRYFCSVLMFFESVYPKTSKQCNFLILDKDLRKVLR